MKTTLLIMAAGIGSRFGTGVYGDVLLYAWDANPENPSNKNSIHLHNLSFYTLCCGSVLSVRMEKTVATCCVGACS